MKNPAVIEAAKLLRLHGHYVFDDWISPGANTDAHWMEYEQARGRTYLEALDGKHVNNVFQFDKNNIDDADIVVLMLPCGKSAHLELGYAIGTGKPGHIILNGDEPWEVMYKFATVWPSIEAFVAELDLKASWVYDLNRRAWINEKEWRV